MSADPIAVLGAGPAGVVAARGLAAAGFAVTLVSAGARRRLSWIEGLSSRALEALASAGCRRALALAAEPAVRTVVWNGRASRANREVLVDRRALDDALREDAAGAGVASLESRVESVLASADRVRVIARDDSGTRRELSAALVVDARGRAAPALASARRGPETIAVGGLWRARRAGQPATTLVPLEHGWCWVAEPGDGRAWVQLVASVRSSGSRTALATLHRTSVASVAELTGTVHASTAPSEVEARSATPILSAPAPADRVIRIGDAAFAPDPLSGSGLFEALASALAVVPVAATIVRDPGRLALALRFHRERVEETFFRLARVGRDFHRAETRWIEAPFWRERSAWPDDEAAHPAPRTGDGRIERRPIARDGAIVEEEVLVTTDHPRGVWRIDDVPLAALLRRAVDDAGADDEQIVRAHATAEGLDPRAIARALLWLRRRGLVHAAAPA